MEDGKGGERHPYLKEHNIQTYLVKSRHPVPKEVEYIFVKIGQDIIRLMVKAENIISMCRNIAYRLMAY